MALSAYTQEVAGIHKRTHTQKKSTMNVQSKNAMSVQAFHAHVSVQREMACVLYAWPHSSPRKLEKAGTVSGQVYVKSNADYIHQAPRWYCPEDPGRECAGTAWRA